MSDQQGWGDPYGQPTYGSGPAGQPPHQAGPYGQSHPGAGYPGPGHPGYGYPAYPPPQQPWQPWQGEPQPPWQGAGQQPWPRPEPDPRWSFPHPEPREYHLMLRTWTYRAWKPLVGILLLVAGMLLVLPVLTFPVLLVGIAIEADGADYLDTVLEAATLQRLTPSGLLYLNLTLAGLILWCGLLVRLLHHLRPRWLSSVVPRLRWKFMLACAGMAVVALILQVVVGLFLPDSANPDLAGAGNGVTGTTVALAIVVLLTTPFQAAGEEFAFRGYLLQAIGALARHRWVCIVLTALLFATAHLQFDPPLFFDRFMFGLIAAWLVIRTGGLEAGIALHVLNNYLAFGFAIAFTDLDSALDPGDVSWWNILLTLTQSLSYAVLVLWLARRMGVQRTTRPPHSEGSVEARGSVDATL